MDSSGRLFGSWAPSPTLSGGVDDVPSLDEEPESENCGGTAHFLPRERAKASFSTLKMTLVLDGGGKNTVHRRWLWEAGEEYDNSNNYFMTREEIVAAHVERFIGIHKKHAEAGYMPQADDIMMMTNASRNQGAFGLHFGAFCATIMSQGTPEQAMEWLLPAVSMKITGCLGQTELGHGSNVRGLQTVAHYDATTEEFVLSTPTLKGVVASRTAV
jgi:acyl-CoA oxidase